MPKLIVTLYCLFVMAIDTAFAQAWELSVAYQANIKKHIDFIDYLVKNNNSEVSFIRIEMEPQQAKKTQLSTDTAVALGADTCKALSERMLFGQLLCADLYLSELLKIQRHHNKSELAISGIHKDPPLPLILDLLDEHKPSVGILLGPDSKVLLQSFMQLTHNNKPNFFIIDFDDNPLRAFRYLVERNQFIIAYPDPVIYNDNTLQSLFLSSFRLDVPVIGYDEKLSKSGALYSLSADLLGIAKQVVTLLPILNNKKKTLPKIISPRKLTSYINPYVMKSFGLSIDPVRLQQQIDILSANQQEAQP